MTKISAATYAVLNGLVLSHYATIESSIEATGKLAISPLQSDKTKAYFDGAVERMEKIKRELRAMMKSIEVDWDDAG